MSREESTFAKWQMQQRSIIWPQWFTHLHSYGNLQTFVLVSHRTSNCCKRRERWPESLLPRNQGKQWHPGSSTLSNLPNFSLIATVDWSTCTQQRRLPIFCSLRYYLWNKCAHHQPLVKNREKINRNNHDFCLLQH